MKMIVKRIIATIMASLLMFTLLSGCKRNPESTYEVPEYICSGASDFFNGRGTAGDAARIIQSRASIYIAEQVK